MKKIIIFLLLLLAIQVQAQKVYEVKYEHEAKYVVYVVNSMSQADLLVYKVKYPHEVTRNGLWYMCANKYNSDVTVFFTTKKSRSNLKIYYVKYSYMAGYIYKQRR
jgi:hypothetical protein